jgi:predicted RNA-binding Zn-ribbon protein involved in translation (DUF1610 family)
MKVFDVLYYGNPTGKEKVYSHQYTERWIQETIFCPNCGKKSVWRCDDGGDFYVGEKYLCLSCSHGFYLPVGTEDMSDDEHGKQRLMNLKEV